MPADASDTTTADPASAATGRASEPAVVAQPKPGGAGRLRGLERFAVPGGGEAFSPPSLAALRRVGEPPGAGR